MADGLPPTGTQNLEPAVTRPPPIGATLLKANQHVGNKRAAQLKKIQQAPPWFLPMFPSSVISSSSSHH